MMQWYVVQTKPKKEKDVEQQLKRAQFEAFHPMLKGWNQLKPLFPSYLFVKADLANSQTHRLVRFTRNVNRILGAQEQPVPVPGGLVEALMERSTIDGFVEQEMILKEGDSIRVKSGMLKDLIGMVERNISTAGRIKVLFKWLSGSFRAIVPYRDIERVTL